MAETPAVILAVINCFRASRVAELKLGRRRGGGGEEERRIGRREGERRRSRWRGRATVSPSPGTSKTWWKRYIFELI